MSGPGPHLKTGQCREESVITTAWISLYSRDVLQGVGARWREKGGPLVVSQGRSSPFIVHTLCWVSTGISKEGKFKDDLTLVTTEQPFCALWLRPLGILGSYIAKAPGGSMQQDPQPQRG